MSITAENLRWKEKKMAEEWQISIKVQSKSSHLPEGQAKGPASLLKTNWNRKLKSIISCPVQAMLDSSSEGRAGVQVLFSPEYDFFLSFNPSRSLQFKDHHGWISLWKYSYMGNTHNKVMYNSNWITMVNFKLSNEM